MLHQGIQHYIAVSLCGRIKGKINVTSVTLHSLLTCGMEVSCMHTYIATYVCVLSCNTLTHLLM